MENSLSKQPPMQGDNGLETASKSMSDSCKSGETTFPDTAQWEQTILESIPKGSFLQTCRDLLFSSEKSDEYRNNFLQMLARLHNDGKIDCLKELERFCDETGKQPLPHFWVWMTNFSPLFSKLVCPLEAICTLFAAFDKRWQRDGAVGIWWEYLLERFQNESDARQEMLRLAGSRDEFCPGVRIAFSAGISAEPEQWVQTAIGLLQNPGKRSKRFFNGMLLSLADADWSLLGIALRSAFWEVVVSIVDEGKPPFDWRFLYLICHQLRVKGQGGEPCGMLLRRVLTFHEPDVLVMAAIHLALDWKRTDDAERQWSLEAFAKINPSDNGLLQELDGCLYMFVHNRFAATATNFLTSYLVRWNTTLSLFPRFVESIQQCAELIGPTATSWLLSGNPILEKAAAELIPLELENRSIPAIDIEQIRNTQQSLLPVVAKIIGHLFYKPKTMISFLFPCLDFMDAKEKKKLSSVLFDPVCLSFHGEIRKWIESERCNLGKESLDYLDEILGRAEADTAFLAKIGSYPELAPPMQLHAELVRVQENENRNYMEESYKHSILSFLTRNISLLHGKGWIMYQQEKDGSLTRSAQDLKHLSASFSLPCMPNAVGLAFNWLLAALRTGCWSVDSVREFCE